MALVCPDEAQFWPSQNLAPPQTPATMGLGLQARPLWASDATSLPDVHHLASARFLCPWFVWMRHSLIPAPIWLHLDSGQDGSGPIGPPPGGQ